MCLLFTVQSSGFSGTNLGMSNISNLSLNSTGSEEHVSTTPNESSPDTSGNPPYNTPVKGFAMSTPVIPSATQLNAALFQVKNDSVSESDYDLGRHAHNAKERARRYVVHRAFCCSRCCTMSTRQNRIVE